MQPNIETVNLQNATKNWNVLQNATSYRNTINTQTATKYRNALQYNSIQKLAANMQTNTKTQLNTDTSLCENTFSWT